MKTLEPTLSIWGELIELMHGVHGHGGDRAEIYAYRFLPFDPWVHSCSAQKYLEAWEFGTDLRPPFKTESATAALDIFNLFEKMYKVKVEVQTENINATIPVFSEARRGRIAAIREVRCL